MRITSDPDYGPTDYGNGPVRVGIVETSLAGQVSIMHKQFNEDAHLYRVGLLRYTLYKLLTKCGLEGHVPHWG